MPFFKDTSQPTSNGCHDIRSGVADCLIKPQPWQGEAAVLFMTLMQFQSKDLEHFQSPCYTDRAAKRTQIPETQPCPNNRNPKRTTVNKVAFPPARSAVMLLREMFTRQQQRRELWSSRQHVVPRPALIPAA